MEGADWRENCDAVAGAAWMLPAAKDDGQEDSSSKQRRLSIEAHAGINKLEQQKGYTVIIPTIYLSSNPESGIVCKAYWRSVDDTGLHKHQITRRHRLRTAWRRQQYCCWYGSVSRVDEHHSLLWWFCVSASPGGVKAPGEVREQDWSVW